MVSEIARELVVRAYGLLSHWNLGLAAAFLIGFGLLPGLIWFRAVPGNRAKSFFAKIFWLLGALTLGGYGYVLDKREDGGYELNVVVKKKDQTYVVRDGDIHPLEDDPTNWSRLGMRRFGVTYEKTKKALSDVTPSTEIQNDAAEADGGEVLILDNERGGHPEVVPSADKQGHLISLSRVASLMKGGGGAELALIAGEQALKEHGGDTAGMSNLALILATVIALFGGAAIAYGMMAF